MFEIDLGREKTFNEKDVDICLPNTMLDEKMLSEDDMGKIRRQWQIFHELKKIELPNDIVLREKAGLAELAEGTLVHGSRFNAFNLEKLKSIREYGVLSGELIGEPEDGQTHYCADFFRVPQNMSVKEYIEWYHQEEVNEDGVVQEHVIEKNYLARGNNSKLTIIMNTQNSEIEYFLEKDAYTKGYEEMKTIINRLPVNRELPQAKRVAAILCGIPYNFISGFILSPNIIENESFVLSLKDLFGEQVLYFNIDGERI